MLATDGAVLIAAIFDAMLISPVRDFDLHGWPRELVLFDERTIPNLLPTATTIGARLLLFGPGVEFEPMVIPQVTPIQPINVIVQQSADKFEWLKILASGVMGAVFGIIGSGATDLIRERRQTKLVFGYLREELELNMSRLIACDKILPNAGGGYPDAAIGTVNRAIREMHTDRYRYYFENERSIVYKFDQDSNLGYICDLVDEVKAAEAKLEDKMEGPVSDYRRWIYGVLYSAESSWIGKGYEPSTHLEEYKTYVENQEEYGL